MQTFIVIGRIDTPQEHRYDRHGGSLPYVLRLVLRDPAARHTVAAV